MKNLKLNNCMFIVFCFSFVLFFFYLWDLFINIIGFIYPDLLKYEYCDSLENNNNWNNTENTQIRDESNIEEVVREDPDQDPNGSHLTRASHNSSSPEGRGEENTILLSYFFSLKKTKDKIRRRFQWYSREQFKDKYSTYKEFKDNWNPEIKLRKGIRDDIKSVHNNIQEKIEKIRYQKRIIVYFYTRRRRRNS